MIEEIKNILQNVNCFGNSDEKHEVQALIDALLKYSLEPGINKMDIIEQLHLIKFDIE